MIEQLAGPSSAAALVDGDSGATLSYYDLHELVATARNIFAGLASADRVVARHYTHVPVFLLMRNDVASIVAMFALRSMGFVVILVDASLNAESIESLRSSYQPAFVLSSKANDSTARTFDIPLRPGLIFPPLEFHIQDEANQSKLEEIHSEMGFGLTTSGSTGSPKLVRLSEGAVVANARGIASALGITHRDRAISCLPLHYAYGLSLLTSHLSVGASIVLTDRGFVDAQFWNQIAKHKVSSIAGVPYMYEMLDRLGPSRMVPESVRVMTQAGGRLQNNLVLKFHEFMSSRSGQFFVMYGQTEATARISVMPHEWLPEHIGGVGRAIPNGKLEIRSIQHGTDTISKAPLEAGEVGEVWYRGPNVMLGYATSRADLSKGDELRGVLRTGDVGHLNADGCLTITGRLKRIGKLFGVRVDLDEIERQFSANAPTAVIEGDNQLIVFTSRTPDTLNNMPDNMAGIVSNTPDSFDALVDRLARKLRVQRRTIVVKLVDVFPRTSSGKIDYHALRQIIEPSTQTVV